MQQLKQEFAGKKLSSQFCQGSGNTLFWVCVHMFLAKHPISPRDFKRQKFANFIFKHNCGGASSSETLNTYSFMCSFQFARRFFSKYFQMALRRVLGWDLHIDYLCCDSMGFVWSSVLQAQEAFPCASELSTIELKIEQCESSQMGRKLITWGLGSWREFRRCKRG